MQEIWKSIFNCDGYEVSNLGNVRSWNKPGNHKNKKLAEPVLLSFWYSNGYAMVTLSIDKKKKNLSIHSLVAQAFIGQRPDKSIIRHLDDNKRNNSVDNLKYGTYSENGKDAVRNKKLASGENHPLSKLSNSDIDTIRHLVLSLGMTHKSVAEIFGVARSTISGIINSGRRERNNGKRTD